MSDEIQTLDEINERAVPSPSFYLSQANAEFGGNGWASNILSRAGLPAPRWLSTLAGKSSASHSLVVGTQWDRYGFHASNGMGSLSPASVQGFPIIELYYINSQWTFTLSGMVSDERIWVEVPNGPSVLFEFEYSSSGWAIGGDVHGLGQYFTSRVGQSIGLNIYGT